MAKDRKLYFLVEKDDIFHGHQWHSYLVLSCAKYHSFHLVSCPSLSSSFLVQTVVAFHAPCFSTLFSFLLLVVLLVPSCVLLTIDSWPPALPAHFVLVVFVVGLTLDPPAPRVNVAALPPGHSILVRCLRRCPCPYPRPPLPPHFNVAV